MSPTDRDGPYPPGIGSGPYPPDIGSESRDTFNRRTLGAARRALVMMIDAQKFPENGKIGRELALARTRTEEAVMWLERVIDK